MLINPFELRSNLDRLEEIEKSSLRLLAQAIYDYRTLAYDIFQAESDQVADIGEDITEKARKALSVHGRDGSASLTTSYKGLRLFACCASGALARSTSNTKFIYKNT